jgi:hypothetical protein
MLFLASRLSRKKEAKKAIWGAVFKQNGRFLSIFSGKSGGCGVKTLQNLVHFEFYTERIIYTLYISDVRTIKAYGEEKEKR